MLASLSKLDPARGSRQKKTALAQSLSSCLSCSVIYYPSAPDNVTLRTARAHHCLSKRCCPILALHPPKHELSGPLPSIRCPGLSTLLQTNKRHSYTNRTERLGKNQE